MAIDSNINVVEMTRTHAQHRVEVLNGEIAKDVATLAAKYCERAMLQAQLDLIEAMGQVMPTTVPRGATTLRPDTGGPAGGGGSDIVPLRSTG